jgi:lipoprotein-anchoring transpeptidase ErfK/SrfK
MRVCFLRAGFLGGLVCWILCSCTPQDHDHRIVISVADQAMDVYFQNQFLARYQVSTSQFGVGDNPGTCATPMGHLSIAQKIGDGAPLGTVFKDRKPKGLEAQNHNAFDRYIYIHGTPVEKQIGKPASYGCIRMRSQDVIQLFASVGVGTSVDVTADHLPVQPGNIAQAVSAAPSMSSVRR